MLYMRRFFSVPAIVFCLLILSGCGGSSKKGATLKGTVVLPPNVKLEQNDMAAISFAPEGEESGPASSAQINPTDFSFVTKGPTGKGVPPGKYKITVRFQPYKPGETKEKKIFEGINKKYDTDTSRLSYEVTTDSQQSIAIDLNKGTVTKQ